MKEEEEEKEKRGERKRRREGERRKGVINRGSPCTLVTGFHILSHLSCVVSPNRP